MSIEVRNSKYILSDACGWSWSWRWSGGGGGGGFGTWSILGTSALWRLQEVKLQKVQLIHSLGQDRGLITTWDFDGLFFVKIAVYQVSDEGYILPPKRSEKGVMPPKHQQRSKARLSQNQRILCIYIYIIWHWSTLNAKNSHEIPTTFFNFCNSRYSSMISTCLCDTVPRGALHTRHSSRFSSYQ